MSVDNRPQLTAEADREGLEDAFRDWYAENYHALSDGGTGDVLSLLDMLMAAWAKSFPDCGPNLQITEEMIDAGLSQVRGFELRGAWEGDIDRAELITSIFRAMYQAQRALIREQPSPAQGDPVRWAQYGSLSEEALADWREWFPSLSPRTEP